MKRYSIVFLLCGLLTAQKKVPTFEIADVHVSAPGTNPGGGFMPGGRIEIRGQTMLEMISDAYDVEAPMVFGGPGWLNTNKYDVIAKAPAASTSMETLQAMFKQLLVERFSLVVKEEKRDSPVYLLTVGKKGAKLQKAAEEGPAKVVPGTGDPALNVHRVCKSFSMEDLANFLPDAAKNFIDHPVIDDTKLKGKYDFPLDWMGKGVYNQAKANPDGPAAVSIFDAIEKLGLKLEAAKRPLPGLVVVSVNETPTPNVPGVEKAVPTYPTEFEVAELRAAKNTPKPGTPAMGEITFQNGRLETMGATLMGLMQLAYQQNPEGFVDSPKWATEDHFDLIAKTSKDMPFDAIQGMLKNLLADKFKLATHKDERPIDVWVLLAGKKPKLKESDGKQRSDCQIVFKEKRTYVCTNTTMAQFAERLPEVAAAYVRPPLLDLTELKGAFDFEVFWTPKAALPTSKGPTDAAAQTEAATPAYDMTVYEAVDKQLGLRLEQQKHPVPVIVIDRVEHLAGDK